MSAKNASKDATAKPCPTVAVPLELVDDILETIENVSYYVGEHLGVAVDSLSLNGKRLPWGDNGETDGDAIVDGAIAEAALCDISNRLNDVREAERSKPEGVFAKCIREHDEGVASSEIDETGDRLVEKRIERAAECRRLARKYAKIDRLSAARFLIDAAALDGNWSGITDNMTALNAIAETIVPAFMAQFETALEAQEIELRANLGVTSKPVDKLVDIEALAIDGEILIAKAKLLKALLEPGREAKANRLRLKLADLEIKKDRLLPAENPEAEAEAKLAKRDAARAGEWDHRYRRLEEGEVVAKGDEVLTDTQLGWQPVVHTIGQAAPSPSYTAHRIYRRFKAAGK